MDGSGSQDVTPGVPLPRLRALMEPGAWGGNMLSETDSLLSISRRWSSVGHSIPHLLS